ncbi:MAG: Gfo/Idh/MocA family protein [Planctomycetales bacterium]
MSSEHPISVAILGATGRQGRRRADAVARTPGLALGCLVDIPASSAALGELSEKYRCAASTTWENVVQDPSIGAVVVCTPNSWHTPMTIGALQGGKHVLVEKPLCDAMDSAEQMVAEAERAGVTLKVGFSYPYRAPVREGFQHLIDGTIGGLLGVRGVMSHSIFLEANQQRKWFSQPDQAGHGAWFDLGIHLVDLAHRAVLLAGDEFVGVNAQVAGGRLIAPGVDPQVLEEECVALYRTRGGRLTSLHASWVEARPFLGCRFELIGELGRVEIDLGTRTVRRIVRRDGKASESVKEFDYVDPDPCWGAEMAEFRDMIRGDADGRTCGRVGLRVHRLAFAAYESARHEGLPVSLV